MSDAPERRRHRRLPLALQTTIRCGPIALHEMTSDISTGGLCFHTRYDAPMPGAALEVEISLPPSEGVHSSRGRARVSGVVRHVTPLRPDRQTSHRIGVQFNTGLALQY